MKTKEHLEGIQETIVILARLLNSLNIKWILGSSCSLMVQGINIIPRDIDIVISPDGLPLVKEKLIKYIVEEEPDWLKLDINGIEIEFIAMANITFPKPITYKGELVPINSLEEERYWYNKRGKEDMVKLIEKHLTNDKIG